MLKYNIVLKGLKDGEDNYETINLTIQASTEEDVDALIADAIYEVRVEHMYYKMKYVSKVLCE